MKSGNFKWMKDMDCNKSISVNKAIKATGNLYSNIAIKGKNKKAFEGFK